MKISSRGGLPVENCFFFPTSHIYIPSSDLHLSRVLALTPISCDSSQNTSFEAVGISTCNWENAGVKASLPLWV